MRRYGAFLVEDNVYHVHETGIKSADLAGSVTDETTRLISKNGAVLGVDIDEQAGFPTPSRKLEFYSKTLKSGSGRSMRLPVTSKVMSIRRTSISTRARCYCCRRFVCRR